MTQAVTVEPPATPAGTATSAAAIAAKRITQVIRQNGARADGLIEVMHQVQEIHGYLPVEALEQVARELRLPLSRVYGVASFYHLFHLEAPTEHRCAVCLGTACFVKGGADLAAQLEERLAVKLDDPAGNGVWGLQHVSCLGACGQAPVLVVDGLLATKLPVDEPEVLRARLDGLGLPTTAGLNP